MLSKNSQILILSLQMRKSAVRPWKTGEGLRYRKGVGMVRHRWDTGGWSCKISRELEKTDKEGIKKQSLKKIDVSATDRNTDKRITDNCQCVLTCWEAGVSEPDLIGEMTSFFLSLGAKWICFTSNKWKLSICALFKFTQFAFFRP